VIIAEKYLGKSINDIRSWISMEKINRFYLTAGLAALINMNIAQAVPLYYTFEGQAGVNGVNSQAEAVYNELTGVRIRLDSRWK
jgi:hypothetical protein